MIDLELKERCVAALQEMSTREVFETVFVPECGNRMSYESFKRSMRKWKHRASTDTLNAGTYPQFVAHGATVQVDGSGKITQAWIKQSADIDWNEIRDIIAANVPKSDIQPTRDTGPTMLEIPLFDMHFGVADYHTYDESLADILAIVE